MAYSDYVWKLSQGGINTGRPTAVLPQSFFGTSGVDLLDSTGKVIQPGKRRYSNSTIFDFPHANNAAAIRINLPNGQPVYYSTPSFGPGRSRYAGESYRLKMGPGGGSTTGDTTPTGDNPGATTPETTETPNPNAGDSGQNNAPTNSGGTAVPAPPGPFPQFPNVSFPTINTKPIQAAPYTFTDPIEFGKKFGDFNTEQIKNNFQTSTDFASKALNNEIEGLRSFAPAAAALSREQLSIDNQYNQATREAQVNAALPEARGTYRGIRETLSRQGERGEIYARGELPFADRAYELGVRSRAADIAHATGIGPQSLQARKLSDLMSAEQRLGVAQFGENLINQNIAGQENLINQEGQLVLAPTQYSQAGAQIRPIPEVGAGRLTYQGLGALNEATLLSPGAAFQGQVQQHQFETQEEQQTRQYNSQLDFQTKTFNANGLFSADQINAEGNYRSALGQFAVTENRKAVLAGAAQNELNTAFAVGAAGVLGDTAQAGQNVQAVQDGIRGTGGAINAAGGSNALGTGETPPATTTPSATTTPTKQPTTDTTPTAQPTTPTPTGRQAPAPVTAGQVPYQSVNGSSPATYSFAPGAPIPSGYTPLAYTQNGQVAAVDNNDYQSELENFARNRPDMPPIDIGDAANVDRSITEAAGLSYLPTDGFQKIAITGTGRAVYSLPAAAQSGDVTHGSQSVGNTGILAGYLGVSDPRVYDAIGQVGNAAELLAQYDSFDDLPPEVAGLLEDPEAGGMHALPLHMGQLSSAERQQVIAAIAGGVSSVPAGGFRGEVDPRMNIDPNTPEGQAILAAIRDRAKEPIAAHSPYAPADIREFA